MKRKIHNNTGMEIKEGQIVHVDGNKIKGVDTSKFKKGDRLYLDPDPYKSGAFITRSKQNMKVDAITAGLMFVGHFTMIYFWDGFATNAPYNIMMAIFALAAWFFTGRVLIYKLK